MLGLVQVAQGLRLLTILNPLKSLRFYQECKSESKVYHHWNRKKYGQRTIDLGMLFGGLISSHADESVFWRLKESPLSVPRVLSIVLL